MRKGKLKDGRNFFGVKTEHFVTKEVFVMALSEYCYLKDEPVCFTKIKAREILKTHLFYNGIGSGFKGMDDQGNDQEQINKLYSDCMVWVEKNYPYLT